MYETDYFENALGKFSCLANYQTDQLLLAGRKINLKTPSPSLRNKFLPALSHLLTAVNSTEADLTIWYAQDKDLPARLNAPPLSNFNAQGMDSNAGYTEVQIFFQPWQQQVFVFSAKTKTAIYWVADAKDVPWWESTFPFRAIFHLWTRNLPAQLVHAGAIANNHSGVLITGASGSGKSTSCLNLLRAGYNYLGDDYVWVELEPIPVVHALYQTAKVEPDNFDERFSDWKVFLQNPEEYISQKAILHIKEMMPDNWLSSIPLKAILLPKVKNTFETVIEPCKASDSFFAMAPTTLHHLPHNRQTSYQKLLRIANLLPSYNWQLGKNISNFNSTFAEFIAHEQSSN